MSQSIVFLDLETAGTNPERHPIIQVAALAVDESLSPVEAFEAKLAFDLRKANRQSLRKNHYHPGTWALEQKSPAAAARDLADFLRRHASLPKLSAKGSRYHVAQLVAHNAEFDAPFLWEWFRRLDLYLPAHPKVLCTLQRALWYFAERPELERPKDFKLATLCDYFGVSFHAAAAHEALADVAATLGLYAALIRHATEGSDAALYSRSERKVLPFTREGNAR